jgi:hypothetical protein
LFFTGPLNPLEMLVVMLIVFLSVTVFAAILPRPVARVRHHIESGFIKCFLIGLLLTIAIFPLWILILVTIIGIPIALLVFPFVVIGAYTLGAIGTTQYTGFEMGRHTTLRYQGYMRTTLAGIVAVGSPMILATFFNFINVDSLAWILHYIFLSVQLVLFTTGLGAVYFSRFGTQPEAVELDPEYS